MNISQAILQLFPQANPLQDFIVQDDSDGKGAYIAQWNLKDAQGKPVTKPTTAQLQTALDTNQLPNAIAAKIIDLNVKCNQTILAGFTSAALGAAHQYDFDEEAQRNLSGRLTIINANPNYPASFNWKTKDQGPLAHTKAQFTQLCSDSDTFKDGMVAKYWVKKNQAKACTTLTQKDTIDFPTNLAVPSVPIGLKATAGAVGSGKVDLSWTANTDVTMLYGGGYNVYVDGAVKPVNTSVVTGAAFSAVALAVGAHTFQITAVDTDGTESVKCASVSATLA